MTGKQKRDLVLDLASLRLKPLYSHKTKDGEVFWNQDYSEDSEYYLTPADIKPIERRLPPAIKYEPSGVFLGGEELYKKV